MLYASATPQRERERERSASSCVNTQCVVTKFAVSFMVKTLKKEEIIRHISTAANRNAKLMFSFRIGQLWKTCSAKKIVDCGRQIICFRRLRTPHSSDGFLKKMAVSPLGSNGHFRIIPKHPVSHPRPR